MTLISDFVAKVQAVYKTGAATEHSYRSAFETLFANLGVTALNEAAIACQWVFSSGLTRSSIRSDINGLQRVQGYSLPGFRGWPPLLGFEGVPPHQREFRQRRRSRICPDESMLAKQTKKDNSE